MIAVRDMTVHPVSCVFSAGAARAHNRFVPKELGVAELDPSDATEEPSPAFDALTQGLAFRLGLGSLAAHSPCHGFANACGCADCQSRSERVSEEFRGWLEDPSLDEMPRLWRRPKRASQPWHVSSSRVGRKAA